MRAEALNLLFPHSASAGEGPAIHVLEAPKKFVDARHFGRT
jgi:hypothetical protein